MTQEEKCIKSKQLFQCVAVQCGRQRQSGWRAAAEYTLIRLINQVLFNETELGFTLQRQKNGKNCKSFSMLVVMCTTANSAPQRKDEHYSKILFFFPSLSLYSPSPPFFYAVTHSVGLLWTHPLHKGNIQSEPLITTLQDLFIIFCTFRYQGCAHVMVCNAQIVRTVASIYHHLIIPTHQLLSVLMN